MKKAGAEYRAGKVSGKPKKKRRVGSKRRKKVGKVVYKPVAVEHCAPQTGHIVGAVSHTKKLLKSQLGWLLATRATARTQKEKRKLDPRIQDLKRKLRALE